MARDVGERRRSFPVWMRPNVERGEGAGRCAFRGLGLADTTDDGRESW